MRDAGGRLVAFQDLQELVFCDGKVSAIVVNAGYGLAFPVSIALAIIGCFFIQIIKGVK